MMTSVCSIGLATLSFAEDNVPQEQSQTVKDLQLQRLDKSLAVNLKHLEGDSLQTPRKTILRKSSLNKTGLKRANSNKVGLTKAGLKKTALKTVSPVALDLIKEFEGFEEQAYIDTDGTAVIGYGLSTIAGQPVQIGDRISSGEADAALEAQLQEIQRELKRNIKVKLSDRQLSAVASLSFNVGVNQVGESTLVRKINAGDHGGAANEFLRWDKANIGGAMVQVPGLTRRRQAERQLFLNQNS